MWLENEEKSMDKEKSTDKEECVDLSDMPLLQCNEVKLDPEETIAEIIKLNPRKRKNTGKGLKILTPKNY